MRSFDCPFRCSGIPKLRSCFFNISLVLPCPASNPVAGWSYVFVSYCTKDVHIGNKTTKYCSDDSCSDAISYNHFGQRNVNAALAFVKDQFKTPKKMLITVNSTVCARQNAARPVTLLLLTSLLLGVLRRRHCRWNSRCSTF